VFYAYCQAISLRCADHEFVNPRIWKEWIWFFAGMVVKLLIVKLLISKFFLNLKGCAWREKKVAKVDEFLMIGVGYDPLVVHKRYSICIESNVLWIAFRLLW